MIKNKSNFLLSILFILFLLSSCATRVKYYVNRPAELDLHGAKTIAVLPIKPFDYYLATGNNRDFLFNTFFSLFSGTPYDEKRAIEFLQSNIEQKLTESPYIELVSASAVQESLEKGYLNPADVYFTGEVTNYKVNDNISFDRVLVDTNRVDRDGNRIKEYRTIRHYNRDVLFSFKYQIVDSSNNKILCHNNVSIHSSSGLRDHPRDLPDAYSLIYNDLSNSVRKIMKELQPYVVSRTVTLLEDKTKNENMKTADKLAREGKVKESYTLFLNIYEETNLFEAGYNSAVLQQALGNFYIAEKLMSDLYKKTSDSRCLSALSDIRVEINQAKRFLEQTEEKSEYLEY